jgi:hypothetical protein
MAHGHCKLLRKVTNDLGDRVDHVFYVGITDPVKHWQAYQPSISVFRDWILPTFVSKAIFVVRVTVNRDVVYVHTNILRAERLEHFVSTGGELGQIQTYRIKMPGVTDVFVSLWDEHAGHLAKLGGISSGNLPASRKVRFQLFHLLKAKRASDVSEAIIETQQDHLVVPLAGALALPRIAANPVISKAAKRFGEDRIVRRNHTAFASREMFHGMKTEDGHVCNTTNSASAVLCAQGVACVLDHDQSVTIGQLQNGI